MIYLKGRFAWEFLTEADFYRAGAASENGI